MGGRRGAAQAARDGTGQQCPTIERAAVRVDHPAHPAVIGGEGARRQKPNGIAETDAFSMAFGEKLRRVAAKADHLGLNRPGGGVTLGPVADAGPVGEPGHGKGAGPDAADPAKGMGAPDPAQGCGRTVKVLAGHRVLRRGMVNRTLGNRR